MCSLIFASAIGSVRQVVEGVIGGAEQLEAATQVIGAVLSPDKAVLVASSKLI